MPGTWVHDATDAPVHPPGLAKAGAGTAAASICDVPIIVDGETVLARYHARAVLLLESSFAAGHSRGGFSRAMALKNRSASEK